MFNRTEPSRSRSSMFRSIVCALLLAAPMVACGDESESDEDDCDYEASQARCERCLDSCGPGCDPSTDCYVSCSGC